MVPIAADPDKAAAETDDKDAAAAVAADLKQSSYFLNLVIENIPAMVAVKDAKDLRFVLGNRYGDDLTGNARNESIGKNDFDLFTREQAEAFIALDREVLASGELRIIEEEPIRTRFKGTRWLRTLKMPVLDENGQAKYLLAMSEDITERKAAEAALRSSEALFRSLLAASPDAVMAVGAEGKIVLANERFRTMYGYGPEELIGKYASMLTPPMALKDNMERSRDGTEFPTEATLSEHVTDEGRMVIISIRDVTARIAVETQLRQAQKMEAIGNLTGGMAHDFNNLLGIIIGNLDLLREQIADRPESDALADQALSAALRGADLTRRLLAFARRQPLQPRSIDVNDLVVDITKLLSRTVGEQVAIEHRLGDSVWPVTADPVQLEACLVNLVTNARDAMPKGGVLRIGTANRQLDTDYTSLHPGLAPGDYVLIELSDSGTGMDEETMSRIFEPFFTTKEQGKGTGLGLSMVFGFMKQSGGHINVYSELGVGTTFRLYLPRDLTNAAVQPTAATSRFNTGGLETILAVEDNAALRDLVVRQLTSLGYKVFEAFDGASAMAVLEREKIDLLFSDVIMPGGISGYDLGKAAVVRWPGIKVLLTSGFPEEKLNGNGAPPWNMRLLNKPYRKEELARTLRAVFDE